MKVDGYSSDELKSFHRVLQATMAEIGARRVDFPVSEMIARLFEAADRGERDPDKLRAAVLAGTTMRFAPNHSHVQTMHQQIAALPKKTFRPRMGNVSP
jgi:hypothetical protein